MKYIVINADDFGLCSSVTKGIAAGIASGIITDCSVVANGLAFEEAIQELKFAGRTSCGVHLTFVDKERPITNLSSRLLEGQTFFENRIDFLLRWVLFRREASQSLFDELRAQIMQIRDYGIRITHLDSHQHLHIFPGISDLTVRLCKEFKIPFIRVPYADLLSPVAFAVNAFSWNLAKQARKKGIRTIGFLGFRASGRCKTGELQHYREVIQQSKRNHFELMVHPGWEDEDTYKWYSRWNFNWRSEYDSLDLLGQRFWEEKSIKPISFGQLADLR